MKELRRAVRENTFEAYRKNFYRRRQCDMSETITQEVAT
jgi:hypothetical protein